MDNFTQITVQSNLHITATSSQQPFSSVPTVTAVERFDGILSTSSLELVLLFTGMRERSIGNCWFAGDVTAAIVGSFSNDDGDGNEDVKKAIGLC